MGRSVYLIFWLACIYLRIANGCQLQGVNPGLVRITVNIQDVDRGYIYNNEIIDITALIGIVQNAGLNSGPYMRGYISGTTFYLNTNDLFSEYEEHETSSSIILNAQFRCTDGTTITQVFQVNVQDTNNNSPVFLPSNEYDIAIATPLLPGYQITGCQHNIVVRDIDLTTSRIDFALNGSDLFEIEYDEQSSTTAKEFIAILRTSTFIRTLPEPLELIISATDVDATGDPPRTSYATVRITSDSNAEFPEEPVFAQPLYTAMYTEDNTIILNESISLQQGYHDDVEFSLNEEYSLYFGINRNGNDVSLAVTAPLPADILTRQQLHLIIRAEREFTSGATATIVVQLPEEIPLLFERSSYEGLIEDNALTLFNNIILAQGYDNAVNIVVSNNYFSATILGNTITLLMLPLPQETIDENAFLNLEMVASTERSSATAVVTLEIVKNDTVTPLFQSPIYMGSYDTEIGLSLAQIELIQGFDDTVEVTLDGEYANLFELIRSGATSTLAVGSLSLEELGEQTIILTIYASKPRTVGASASIYISLPEEIRLEFEQASYEGVITDNLLQVPNLILAQGYENLVVTVSVSNEYFSASALDNVITLSMGQLPEVIIQENSFINLEVTASTSRSSTSTVVILEIIKNDTVTPLFESALYMGSYSVDTGLALDQINIIQGYDDTVEVTLNGEHSNLFVLLRNGTSSIVTGTIPQNLFSERNIALTVTATKPRTIGSTAVINIALPTDRLLEFAAATYRGTYQDNVLTLGIIALSTGYDETVVFGISGDYDQYFAVSNTLDQVSIQLSEQLPDAAISENNFLHLTLSATGLNALPTTTSVLIEIIKDDISTPVFTQNIYSGTYADGSVVIQNINLVQGFDSTVSFRLDGDNSQYFSYSQVGNGITLSLSSAIPEEVIFNQKALVFNVLADKPLTVGANAAILITFPSELTDTAVMRFSQNTYIGSLEDGNLTINSLVLDTGYAPDIEFLLTGDHSSYFTISHTNEILTITLSNTLPQDVVEGNKFIVLEVEARRDRAVSVFCSVIIELVREETVDVPVFNAAYYRGSYGLEAGLMFTEQIYIVHGYDDIVSLELEGELSELFSVSDDNNVITLSANAIPESIWENNDQLIFSLIARKPGVPNGQAAIVIDMPKENTTLSFERTNYIGTLEDGIVNIDLITLTEGYSTEVEFVLIGDLQSYFALSNISATVALQLITSIPQDLIPSNGIIVLQIEARSTHSVPAVTTLILEVIQENLIFAQTYYVGTYTTTDGLSLETAISLSEGYDENVQFNLVGGESVYFGIVQTGNSISLSLTTSIPPAVIANNNQLIFVINALSASGGTTSATLVISLPNEISETNILGFERNHYVGSIDDSNVNLDPITLTEGYSTDVSFELLGDLQTYFELTPTGATVTLQLSSTIPEDSIPANGIIILEVQAATPTGSLPAVTTIVLEVVSDTTPDAEDLVFAQTYYVGTYTTTAGLAFDSTISLTQGYDESVQFNLSGDESNYFSLSQNGNAVSLSLSTTIPPAVVANNNQLVFVVNAQSSTGATAEATIVIALPNEITDSVVLGFERTNYLGSINNNVVALDAITLSEGYTADVVFTLQGDLQNYFALTPNGASVTLQLSSTIPEDSIPANGIIILEVQAATPTGSLPAVTTIVLEVVSDTTPDAEDLVFAQTYYVGTYTTTAGLAFDSTISLTQGYDESVQFNLSGDESNYFSLSQNGNAVSLSLSTTIPPAVVANNNQLVFVVNAQSSTGATAEATIVIALPYEITDSIILGFERTNYLGSINNNVVALDAITLSEGYTADVVFTLQGDLQNYFALTPNGASVTLQLSSTIPEDSIPANGIIILEVQAATPTGSLPAVTTIVLEVVSDTTPDAEDLVFAQTYYVGTYTTTAGLAFDSTISLTQGYDESVQFNLSGDESNYFSLSQNGNAVSLSLSTTIPPAVVANNNQLVFVVNAQSSTGATAEATIVIALPNEITDSVVLGFERTNYLGSINNNVVALDAITLSEGYTADVVFTLQGDLQNYFALTPNGATVTLQLSSTISEDSIPANGIIILEVQAATPTGSLPAVTTIVLEVVSDTTPDAEDLVFAQTYYVGTYTTTAGLAFDSTISLTQGYDESVQFNLSGDESNYFSLSQNGNAVSLSLSTTIPPAVVANNNQLVFVVNAQSSTGATAEATIVIALPNEITDSVVLGFERTNYLGAINDNVVALDAITLSEGYTADVVFTLQGDLQNYFALTPNGATVTLQLSSTIPEDSIPANGIIILEVQAATPTGSLPAVTTIVLEVVSDTTPDAEDLVFAQTYYVGTYTTTAGLAFDSTISLTQGYDESVQFNLSGDESNYFSLSQNGNAVSLSLSTTIPPAVVANNNQLVFVVNAQSSTGATAEATIVIALPNEITDSVVLGFERTNYLGAINDNVVALDAITLSEGYTADVVFTLQGDLQNYFALTPNGATVTLQLSSTIPEDSIPANGIIILEVQAATPTGSLPAVTTIVLEVVSDTTPDAEDLVFAQTYYVGTYTTTAGLAFDSTISLTQGYDESVQFNLSGDESNYFSLSQNGNAVSLSLSTTIPPAVVANNNQLVFVVNAQSSTGATAEATIVIALPNEITDSVVLGFERTNYLGAINDNVVALDAITLSEGYTADVVFTLQGDLQNYFALTPNGATVTLQLSSTIPEDSIPANGIIILEVQAATPTGSLPAVTTIVLEVVSDTTPDAEDLVFAQTYYVGTYTTTAGLAFDSTISLTQGYDESVQFNLSGDESNYFSLSQNGNAVSLSLSTTIPPAVVANNNQLVFVVNAQSSTGATAEATIVIALPNEITDSVVLGFERTNYLGAINDNVVALDAITLSEGYTADVVFTLQGDLQNYFALTPNGATVTLQLSSTIPEDSIPANGIIILEVQAATPTGSLPAVTTIVLEVVSDTTPDAEDLVFAQTYYVGTYTTTAGLAFDSTISLTQGYDESVQFNLSGDESNYFSLSQNGNAVSLSLSTTIPPAVVANNNQLVFVVNAQSSTGATAEATIVIALPNEITDSVVLGFERTNYLGAINDNVVALDAITLSEGYTADVVFTLQGDLQNYFALTPNGATVTLQLSSTIPEDSIPANGIIILEVQAATPTGSLPAVTTIVLEVVSDTTPDAEDLVFAQTYYVGTYTTTAGLAFDSTISLTQGYDESVQFNLSGDESNYFSLSQNGNAVSLSLSTTIPPAVVANNNQLVFVVNAQSSTGATAEATIVIALPNEITDSVILGFERTNYLGSINNNVVTLDAITLSEGYTADVVFTLQGDLQNYFALTPNGATVTLQLSSTIPENSVPANGIIILEVQAATPTGSLPAVTTIVLEVVSDTTPDAEVLVFAQTYYVGTYTTTAGLSFDSIISLTQGYDYSVQFNLSGDESNYFSLSQNGNAVSLSLSTTIPPAVVANNNQLVFVVNAQSSTGATAEATIVIALPNEITDSVILGFERTNYLGSINNNVVTLDAITLSEGYTADVVFTLQGDLQNYFALTPNGATVTLQLSSTIPENSVPANGIIILEVQAATPTGSLPAVTTIVLEVVSDTTPDAEVLVFAQTYYVGTYTTTAGLSFDSIISLTQGYDYSVQFNLSGDESNYFSLSQNGNAVSLSLSTTIPPAVVANNNQLVFVVNAQSNAGATAEATIIIALPNEFAVRDVLGFERTSYLGSILNNAVNIEPITLTEGYTDDITFTLNGDLQSHFSLARNGATVTLQLQTTIPEDQVPSNGIIMLIVQASAEDSIPAVSTIVLEFERSNGATVVFSKVLYEGLLQGSTLQHEAITVTGHDETSTVDIIGEYSELFTATFSDGVVTVLRTGSVTLPTNLTHVAVEIRVGDAAAVLLIQVSQSDTPNPPPTVTFSPSSYVVRIEMHQTGVFGRVVASADNGESLGYSLIVEDGHLAARISVNNDGELLLFAPANTGEYTFQVVATTLVTQATGTATVHLSVDDTSIVLPPLVVLDRDEEEPHSNLMVFSGSEYANCTYTLTNLFPANQTWIYVDEMGLHTTAIDREDPSIAFMALSQVQVELEVHCNSLNRNERSIRESRLDWLGPYDYGTSTWILGESIAYNPTRSVINLIVNDINDNAPIFIGKEDEPIVVGYPVAELKEVVLPRALAELQATDADVGENAALMFWSAEPVLAVSPTLGSVHVRDDSTLEEDQALVVHATDRNGQGLSGSINLVVKLLDESNIAVVTIRNAFLEDESSIIANLSSSVGYEVKVLRAVVISDETESIEENIGIRKKRQTSESGASLQLYVYGLIQRVPVAVEELTEDLNSNATAAIGIASTLPLRDHLEARQPSPGRDVGLLVATIVLSILLFILIVAILVWFFLKWRKERNYDEFSDENSLESRNESIQPPKVDVRPKPRIDIDELKRSERRLQEMIDAPYNEIVTPTTSTIATPVESVIDISQPDPTITVPIVINDKLKDADDDPSDIDEFGEIKTPRRKSVVTFNENVERIIHVDDSVDGSTTSSDIEIFRL